MADISKITVGGTTYNIKATYAGYAGYISSPDTRNVNPLPKDLSPMLRADFKSNSAIGLSGHSSYSGVITFRPYGSTTDFSGGPAYRIAMAQDGAILYQTGDGSGWGSWSKLNAGYADTAGSANAVAWANVSGKPSFATVATSGSYNDLSNKPTIPAAQVQTDWNATSGMGVLLHKPSSLPASDVYAWAKASTKPSYTAAEVGAVPTTRKVNNKALSADISLTASDVGALAVNGKAASATNADRADNADYANSADYADTADFASYANNATSAIRDKNGICLSRPSMGTTSGSVSGWFKININAETSWMTRFSVRVYEAYKGYDIAFQGYNYSTNHWYSPKAQLMSSSEDSVEVKFGYDGNYKLWVAVPAREYYGIMVYDVVNGYTQVTDFSDKFTITYMTSLTGTVQETQTLYRPWLKNETVSNATYATSASSASSATTASKLSTNAGGTTTPVYFSGGVPVALSYTIAKSVPSDAKFTDTTYESKAAASGGTAVSLCTTGEKYTWNNKANAFSVTDGDPTLAWSTRSKVATIAGTDIHVTMPANPGGGGGGNVKYQSSSGTVITVNSMSVGEMTYVYMSASGAKRLRMPSGGSYFVIDMTGVSVYNDYGSEIGFRLLQSRGRLIGNSYTEYRSWDLALVVRVG